MATSNNRRNRNGPSGERTGLFPFCIDDNIKIDVGGIRFGSLEEIVEERCNACRYPFARRYVDYPRGEEMSICNGCGHRHGAEYDYDPDDIDGK